MKWLGLTLLTVVIGAWLYSMDGGDAPATGPLPPELQELQDKEYAKYLKFRCDDLRRTKLSDLDSYGVNALRDCEKLGIGKP
jgi:hypothetical protein